MSSKVNIDKIYELETILFCFTINSLCLSCVPLGRVLRIVPQQGQLAPSQLTKSAQIVQRFWPDWYLPTQISFVALYL